jgi:hypothetical protein
MRPNRNPYGSTSGLRVTLSYLRAPDKFNLDARNLVDAWKKWKEELNLYIDLTMDDDNEPAKVKLFLYLNATRGREIYETMTFANAPENRTLLMVSEAFGYHK